MSHLRRFVSSTTKLSLIFASIVVIIVLNREIEQSWLLQSPIPGYVDHRCALAWLSSWLLARWVFCSQLYLARLYVALFVLCGLGSRFVQECSALAIQRLHQITTIRILKRECFISGTSIPFGILISMHRHVSCSLVAWIFFGVIFEHDKIFLRVISVVFLLLNLHNRLK